MKAFFRLVVSLLLLPLTATAQSKKRKVFLLAGQSNREGHANGEGTGMFTTGYGARGFNSTQDGGKIGPEFMFGLTLNSDLTIPFRNSNETYEKSLPPTAPNDRRFVYDVGFRGGIWRNSSAAKQ